LGEDPRRDEELVGLALGGDLGAFGAIVRRYQDVDGFSYRDIADHLSVSATTVKGRLQMGRDLLRKELADTMEDELFKELLEKAAGAEEKKGPIRVWGTDMKESLALVEQALARAGELGTAQERDTARMQALIAKAQYLPNTEESAQRQLCEKALVLARKLKDHLMTGRLMVQIAVISPPREAVDEIGRMEEAAREFRKAGDKNGEGEAILFTAFTLLERGEFHQGRGGVGPGPGAARGVEGVRLGCRVQRRNRVC
jgi:hypothetical protein